MTKGREKMKRRNDERKRRKENYERKRKMR
jgi:hypothetical protein